jgi:glycosyltransferase involved in cell wall biosynthesis
LSLFKNKTIKIGNWYGSNRYYPAQAEEKKQNRGDLDIPEKAFVIISVGGCDENKRHHDIIKALPLIVDQIPNLIYLHLGCGKTEEEEKQLSVDKGVSEIVRFCGNQRDVRKYLTVSDVYLMTSHYEGISITTIEAMACRIPTILYDVPGLRDFNKKGENSVLITEDYKILAEKILYLYKHPEKITEITINALAMVDNCYDMEKNVAQIYNLYLQ